MAVKFYPHNHSYESVDLFDKIHWTSVTTLVGMFKEPFNAEEASVKASLNKKSKWYGIHPDKIREYWRLENKRSIDLGTWYHNQQEKKLLDQSFTTRHGTNLPIIRSLYEDGIKIAPDQKLIDGVYPEHFVFLKSQGTCGQADEVNVLGGHVHIEDHKSNKDLKKPAYVSWNGSEKKLLSPLIHLPDCKLSDYALQLSIYLYIVLKHNPHLKPGTLVLNHVTFEEEGRNEFDYPIMRLDASGDPILKGVEKIPVPYLKSEVESMFKYKNIK